MIPVHANLPDGTIVRIHRSGLNLSLCWVGPVGLHMVELEQHVQWDDQEGARKGAAEAVALFIEAVGLEVLGDALQTGVWPTIEQDEAPQASEEKDTQSPDGSIGFIPRWKEHEAGEDEDGDDGRFLGDV